MSEILVFSTTVGTDMVLNFKRPPHVTARNSAILEALVLIACWGAAESFVEDVCKAVLQERSDRIDPGKFGKFKFNADELLSSPEDRLNAVFKAVTNAVAKGVGVGRFENLLAYVDLDGEVPDVVRTGIYESQQIRNIWAHKAGRADKRFVDAAPMLSFSEGDSVEISSEALYHYVLNFTVYSTIVCSRYLMSNGGRSIRFVGEADDPSVQAYNELYPSSEDSESDTSPTESDDPPA